MMRIPPDLARTLAVVVDEGSLDAAARRLHITPSAVSQRIRALEDTVGRVLLVRSKPVRATAAAHPVMRFARELDLLERTALAELDGSEQAVRMPLGVNADSLATWLLPALTRAGRRRPVVFDLHREDQDHTAALLESGAVMAAVTTREHPVAGCRVRRLGVLRYVAVAAPGFAAHWLADGATADALAVAPVVDFDERDDLQSQWLRARGAGTAAPPRHRVPASADFAAAVAAGWGWALLPTLQAHDALADGRLVGLGGPPVDVELFWQQWNVRSGLLDDVADEVVAAAGRDLL